MTTPKVFGREMDLVERNKWATHWQLWAGSIHIGLSVYETGSVEWSAACKKQPMTGSVSDALLQIEARVRELVTGLGPLVGWSPTRKSLDDP